MTYCKYKFGFNDFLTLQSSLLRSSVSLHGVLPVEEIKICKAVSDFRYDCIYSGGKYVPVLSVSVEGVKVCEYFQSLCNSLSVDFTTEIVTS